MSTDKKKSHSTGFPKKLEKNMSYPRTQESKPNRKTWIPAFAGMTRKNVVIRVRKTETSHTKAQRRKDKVLFCAFAPLRDISFHLHTMLQSHPKPATSPKVYAFATWRLCVKQNHAQRILYLGRRAKISPRWPRPHLSRQHHHQLCPARLPHFCPHKLGTGANPGTAVCPQIWLFAPQQLPHDRHGTAVRPGAPAGTMVSTATAGRAAAGSRHIFYGARAAHPTTGRPADAFCRSNTIYANAEFNAC